MFRTAAIKFFTKVADYRVPLFETEWLECKNLSSEFRREFMTTHLPRYLISGLNNKKGFIIVGGMKAGNIRDADFGIPRGVPLTFLQQRIIELQVKIARMKIDPSLTDDDIWVEFIYMGRGSHLILIGVDPRPTCTKRFVTRGAAYKRVGTSCVRMRVISRPIMWYPHRKF